MLQITNGNSLTEKALGKQKIKNAVYRQIGRAHV